MVLVIFWVFLDELELFLEFCLEEFLDDLGMIFLVCKFFDIFEVFLRVCRDVFLELNVVIFFRELIKLIFFI